MNRRKRLALSLASVLAISAVSALADTSGVAHAQEDRVSSLIELVKTRPAGKDRDAWREERREAARELGSLGDKRAVPVLIQLVKDEPFDAVGEISIVALGKLGDPAAIPVLQEVANDSSRDRFVREAAREALGKLGAEGGAADSNEDDDPGPGLSGLSSLSATSSSAKSSAVRFAPAFPEDTLAAAESLTFAVGDSRISYDTIRKEPSFEGNARSRYLRLREGKKMALRFEGTGDLATGIVNYDGDDSSSRQVLLNLAGAAEARFYLSDSPVFAIGGASALVGVQHLRVNRPGADNTTSENFLSSDIAIALGAGYGRSLNIGEALRVKRIEMVLRDRKILGRPIGPDLAERLMLAWWTLRREQGFHDRLVATVAILREAGVLLGEPDASASYAILRVLEDGQLSQRFSGLQAHLALGESVLFRDDDLGLEEGRIESLLSQVRYGKQNEAGDGELVATGFARLRILADEDEGEASPWALGGEAHWRSYQYNDNLDPLGALDIGVAAGASNDGLMDSEFATRLAGSIGWLWVPSRASRFRLAGEGRWESGELFLGAVFEGQYGLIDAAFVGAGVPR